MKQGLNNFQHYKNIHAIHSKNDSYLHLYQQEPDVSLSVVEHKIIITDKPPYIPTFVASNHLLHQKHQKMLKTGHVLQQKTKKMQRNCWIKLQRIKKSFPLTILKESG